jgi:peptidoglycan/LPS O-acetylase OafA/YrhL
MADQICKVGTQRFDWIDNLRSLNILGTVAFHASLSYSPYIIDNQFEVLKAFPLIQTNQPVLGVDILLGLRLSYAMQLMFYISGLFVWRSLRKRGWRQYIHTRLKRLLIPFACGYLIIMPITYAAAMVQNERSITDILITVTKSFMPGTAGFGQLWFLLLLFAFDLIAATIYAWHHEYLEKKLQNTSSTMLYGLLVVSVIAGYLLLVNSADRSGWTRIVGNLIAPLPRIGMYAAYFTVGIISGYLGLKERTKAAFLFTPCSNLKPKIPVGFMTVALFIASGLARAYVEINKNILENQLAWLAINTLYPITGLFIVMSLILLAKRHLNFNSPLMRNLNKNSYGIYIIHWAYVSWIQLVLTHVNTPAAINPWIATCIAIPASWLTSAWMNQNRLGQIVLGP